MASRATDSGSTPSTRKPPSDLSPSSSMDLLGNSPPSTAPGKAGGNPASPVPSNNAPTPAAKATTTRAVAAAASSSSARSPARLSNNAAPSKLAQASDPVDKKDPIQKNVSPAESAEVTATRGADVPSSAVQTPQNNPIALAAAAAASVSSSTSAPGVACKTGSDCTSKVCIAGRCQTSSGFALSISSPSSASTAFILSTSQHSKGHKGGKHGTPTACSDPRCTLPAAITSLNGAEEKDISASLGSHQRAVSSAATAGIVLALLFATLAVLLIVPKVRDWTRKCFACNKESNGIVLDDDSHNRRGNVEDDGSPEFGNHHASAFISEKRRTTAYLSNNSYNEYQQDGDYLPGYEGGQGGDISDVKIDLKQEPNDYFGEYNSYYHHQQPTSGYGQQQPQDYLKHRQEAPPVLPALDYINNTSTRDLSSYVERNPPPAPPPSAPIPLSQVRPAEAQYVPPLSKPASITPWASTTSTAAVANGRNAQARETVLPYTVEEDRDALVGLRSLGTPAVNDTASGQPFSNMRDAYTTPVMQSHGFDNNVLSPQTPITPGSAYSVRTTLLPASLRPGNGQGQSQAGRAPILKQGLMASRPTFKRLSNALRFDSSAKRS